MALSKKRSATLTVFVGERLERLLPSICKKGRPILVSGRLDQRSWEQDGNKRSKVEVVVEDFNFIGGGGGDGGGSYGGNSGGGSTKSTNDDTSSKKDDVVVEEIEDKPIDLSDIPF